jgi:hypothetical protein
MNGVRPCLDTALTLTPSSISIRAFTGRSRGISARVPSKEFLGLTVCARDDHAQGVRVAESAAYITSSTPRLSRAFAGYPGTLVEE